MRLCGILLICVFITGCAALMTEQTYVLIDAPVKMHQASTGRYSGLTGRYRHDQESIGRYGYGYGYGTLPQLVFYIPEKEWVRKIRILGTGEMQNIEIWVPIGKNWDPNEAYNWKLIKHIKTKVTFPIDIPITLSSPIDAVQIRQRTAAFRPGQKGWNRTGRINTVEFYTTAAKD